MEELPNLPPTGRTHEGQRRNHMSYQPPRIFLTGIPYLADVILPQEGP